MNHFGVAQIRGFVQLTHSNVVVFSVFVSKSAVKVSSAFHRCMHEYFIPHGLRMMLHACFLVLCFNEHKTAHKQHKIYCCFSLCAGDIAATHQICFS